MARRLSRNAVPPDNHPSLTILKRAKTDALAGFEPRTRHEPCHILSVTFYKPRYDGLYAPLMARLKTPYRCQSAKEEEVSKTAIGQHANRPQDAWRNRQKGK